MKLLHYDAKPFVLDPDRKYGPTRGNGKPHGLWLSVEGEYDWKWWCEAEEFCLPDLRHVTEVRLKPGHDVFVIDSPELLKSFHEQYKVPVYPGSAAHFIDWDRVKEKVGGVIIAPYQWEYRLHPEMLWYYGWDCASGCVWNLSAIEQVMEATSV